MVTRECRWAAYILMIAAAALANVACGVESVDAGTGGVDDDPNDNGDEQLECPRGLTVVLSDFASTQVALSALDGETLSASFLSTASTETAGLAFALSGDVTVPSSRPASGRIVLLDRFGTNVITWADPSTAEVLGQLPVGTGFESNPHDYLEVGEGIAFVSRWGHNEDPDQEHYDQGDDLLVIDTEGPAILRRIPMPVIDDVPPRPSGMLRLGDEVIVSLDRTTTSWTAEEAMLVGVSIESEEVIWEANLSGFKACGRPVLSPDGTHLAVACTGPIDSNGESDPAQSVLLLFDAEERPLREVQRFSGEELAGEAIQKRIAFARNDLVLFVTQTAYLGDSNNRWMAVDLTSGSTEELLEASPDADGAGRGTAYGSSTCIPGCSDICLMADGAAGVLQRLRVKSDGALELLDPVTVETNVGLPPRGIGLR